VSDPFLHLAPHYLKVSEQLQCTWHRPALEVVEHQHRDPQTVRIFLNGCFDLMHVGHFNALRQAKNSFYQRGFKTVVLVAGVHSDSAITRQKGEPFMCQEERVAVVQATKWVDEMVSDLPYVSMSVQLADALYVDWVCHGDDLPVVKNGSGMYSDVMNANRFHLIKRTEGISTTQILERLLRQEGIWNAEITHDHQSNSGECQATSDCNSSGILDTTLVPVQLLSQFAAPANPRIPQRVITDASKIVYVSGAFDLLHSGHVHILEQAAALGDYLLVGIYSDEAAHQKSGFVTALTMLERAMAILALRVVDDVVLNAPLQIHQQLISTFNISTIVSANAQPLTNDLHDAWREHPSTCTEHAPEQVNMVLTLTDAEVRQRFVTRRGDIEHRNSDMFPKELAYIESKRHAPESKAGS